VSGKTNNTDDSTKHEHADNVSGSQEESTRAQTLKDLPLAEDLEKRLAETGSQAAMLLGKNYDIESTDKLEVTLSRMLNLLDETSTSLVEREQMFRHLAETIPNLISVHHDLKILYANPAFADFTGVDQKYLAQRQLTDFIHPDDHETLAKALDHKNAHDNVSHHYIVRVLNKNGRYVAHSNRARVVTYRGLHTVISCSSDLSMHQSLKRQVDREKSFSRNILHSLDVGIIVTDKQGIITEFNHQAAQITGRKISDAIGKHASLIMHLVREEDHKPLSDPVSQVLQSKATVTYPAETLIQSRGLNTFLPIRVRANALVDERNNLLGVSVLLQDSVDQRAISEKLTYEATHDALTNLINRREFEQRLGQALREAVAGEKEHVLCYLDLNNFKPINDMAGHRAGDDVLKQVSEKLTDIVRDTDSVGRIGGDEFGILLYGCPLIKAREIVQEICETISHHVFRWNEERFSLGVACGLVCIREDATTIPEVLNSADTACYIAKELGGSRYHVFNEEDSRVARDQGSVVWQHRIQDALTHNRLELHIQKIASLNSLSDSGLFENKKPVMQTTTQKPAYEITVRLLDEQGTRYRPELFMPAARRFGLLSAIDRVVVKNAFYALSRGLISLEDNQSCSINLSAETFADKEFLGLVVEAFDEYKVNPKNICFEVPEPDVIAHLDNAKRFINVLNDLGSQFALDDFGRELQSFTYLKQLNIHFLKLDGFYVRTIVEDDVNRAMVAAMIKLAHSLGMKVIAEQVESQAVLDVLAELGADYAQGFAIENTRSLPI